MKVFLAGARWLLALFLVCLLPVVSHADGLQVKKLLVFGDSLSDSNGTYSTWKLLNTLKGNTVNGQPMMNLQPFLNNALKQDVPGYAELTHHEWLRDELSSLEKHALNAFLDMTKTLPIPILPDPHYYLTGMFSGGTDFKGVWPLYLYRMLGAELDNRAMAGSWTLCSTQKMDHLGDLMHICSGPESMAEEFVSGSLVPPCEGLIVSAWAEQAGTVDSDSTLVIFFNSANDYLNQWPDPQQVVNKYTADITRLIRLGAKHVVVINLPDISLTPRYREAPKHLQAWMANAIETNNRELKQSLAQLRTRYPDVALIELDAAAMLTQLLAGAAQRGIVTDKACLDSTPGLPTVNRSKESAEESLVNHILQNPSLADAAHVASAAADGQGIGMCTNPDDHFFFDTVHPSAHTHYEIALYACELLQKNGIACSTTAVQPLITAPEPIARWF
ncbi:SGNH/GDSL hydrolase family protein [Kistimonas scapharcae]|uniref:SGNH/GDSL hydrolase family protein n=1 Tax=Kistimonas scapharcae TaxID=1036133 RepID=A0ABP8V5Y2_9GAMM